MRACLLLLLLPVAALGQIPGAIVLGGAKPTPAQVQQAQAVLAAAENKALAWQVGDFDFIQRGAEVKGPLVFDASDETIVSLKEIPANTLLLIENARRAGQAERKDHEVQPQATPYYRAKALKEGRTVIKVWANGDTGQPPRIIAKLEVTVGQPPEPAPPGPGPNPPGPTPIPPQGLRVLIVLETKDLSNLPSAQVAAINAREVREWLNAKCTKVNGHPEWRVYDQDTDTSRESAIWQAAMKRPRQSLPWLLVSDGQKGYEGPLPANTDELLKLLKQYGGN